MTVPGLLLASDREGAEALLREAVKRARMPMAVYLSGMKVVRVGAFYEMKLFLLRDESVDFAVIGLRRRGSNTSRASRVLRAGGWQMGSFLGACRPWYWEPDR